MNIILFGIKRLMNKKSMVIFVYLLPLIFSIFVMNISTSKIKVGFVDDDKTKLTKIIRNKLEDNYDLVCVKSDESKIAIANNSVTTVIAIEKGFTKNIFYGKDIKLKLYTDKKSEYHKIVNQNISILIQNARRIYSISNKNVNIFYKNISKPIYKTQISNSTGKMKQQGTISIMFNFLVMFLLLNSCIFSRSVINDDRRIFAAPISVRSYVLQNLSLLVLVDIIQVLLVFVEITILYGSIIFQYFLPLLLLFLSASIMSVTFAMLLNGVLNKTWQTSFSIIPMCMLGGCFWGIDNMPKEFRFAAQFVPTKWVVDGINNILIYNNYKVLNMDILIILLFAIAFLFTGTITKKDVIK